MTPDHQPDIRSMFDRIAGVYDAMNLLISGFQEPRWRRAAAMATRPRPGMRVLDVACGTGTLSRELLRHVSPGGYVLGIDFAPRMIAIARRRARDSAALDFQLGDALQLPVPDESFDAATIAFGMRNLADHARGFAELHRTVRPGGRVVCLEISRPRTPAGRFVALWFDRAVPILGRLIGHGDAYAYLVRSARAYPEPDRMATVMRRAGLEDVRWRPLAAGLVTLHVGRRPSS
jgi:demethylmenaquinone methyltransferase / 2-methoxy-6-polyprenyl-1,4-benzoquinol methylase